MCILYTQRPSRARGAAVANAVAIGGGLAGARGLLVGADVGDDDEPCPPPASLKVLSRPEPVPLCCSGIPAAPSFGKSAGGIPPLS